MGKKKSNKNKNNSSNSPASTICGGVTIKFKSNKNNKSTEETEPQNDSKNVSNSKEEQLCNSPILEPSTVKKSKKKEERNRSRSKDKKERDRSSSRGSEKKSEGSQSKDGKKQKGKHPKVSKEEVRDEEEINLDDTDASKSGEKKRDKSKGSRKGRSRSSSKNRSSKSDGKSASFVEDSQRKEEPKGNPENLSKNESKQEENWDEDMDNTWETVDTSDDAWGKSDVAWNSSDTNWNKSGSFPNKNDSRSSNTSGNLRNDKGRGRGKGKSDFRFENRNYAIHITDSAGENSCYGDGTNFGRDDYEDFNKMMRVKKIDFGKLKEVIGDLFTAPEEESLAHCVAEDMNMGSGIAVKFRQDFQCVGELLEQRVRQGGCAFLRNKERYIYYLVTKRVSSGKPTYETLWKSLLKLKELMRNHEVTRLSIPRIGCGLDRLEWSTVWQMLNYVFRDVPVTVTVYNIGTDNTSATESSPSVPQKKVRSTAILNQAYPLADMDNNGAILIYLCAEDGTIFSTGAEALQGKFHFEQEFRTAKKEIGHVIRTEKKGQNSILYGFVVKKTAKARFNYVHFEACVRELQKCNRKDAFEYVGLEALSEENEPLLMAKLANVLMNSLSKVYIYVCWPKDLQNCMPLRG